MWLADVKLCSYVFTMAVSWVRSGSGNANMKHYQGFPQAELSPRVNRQGDSDGKKEGENRDREESLVHLC